jgi:hypothetical protein
MTADVRDKPPTLSDDEVTYHVFLVERVKEAQAAQAMITQTQGAWANWADYLKSRYGFLDGDVITEEGIIVTASASGSSTSPDGVSLVSANSIG